MAVKKLPAKKTGNKPCKVSALVAQPWFTTSHLHQSGGSCPWYRENTQPIKGKRNATRTHKNNQLLAKQCYQIFWLIHSVKRAFFVAGALNAHRIEPHCSRRFILKLLGKKALRMIQNAEKEVKGKSSEQCSVQTSFED